MPMPSNAACTNKWTLFTVSEPVNDIANLLLPLEIAAPLRHCLYGPFKYRREALPAADAHGLEAVTCPAPIHFTQERREDPPAGRANRMAERNARAMHIHPLEIGGRELPFSCA